MVQRKRSQSKQGNKPHEKKRSRIKGRHLKQVRGGFLTQEEQALTKKKGGKGVW